MPNPCRACGNGDSGEAAATIESAISNVCHLLGDGDSPNSQQTKFMKKAFVVQSLVSRCLIGQEHI